MKRRSPIEWSVSMSMVALVLVAWTIVSYLHLVNPLFLPSPAQVTEAFVSVARDGYQGSLLYQHLLASLARVMYGFAIACVIGIPLGLLMGCNRYMRAAFDPLVEFYRPLPPLALYTLLVMWLGIGDESKVALLALSGLPALTVSAMNAAAGVDAQLVKAARSLGASRAAIFWTVIVPACLPAIFTGMRLGLGFTYTVLVAAEIVAANRGIGWMIWDASKFMLTSTVIMGLIVMGVTGWLLDSIVRVIQRFFTSWLYIS